MDQGFNSGKIRRISHWLKDFSRGFGSEAIDRRPKRRLIIKMGDYIGYLLPRWR